MYSSGESKARKKASKEARCRALFRQEGGSLQICMTVWERELTIKSHDVKWPIKRIDEGVWCVGCDGLAA